MPSRHRSLGSVAFVALLLGAAASPARADLVITAQDSSASAGGTGSFDVTLRNTGTTDVNVSGFQVELSLPGGSGIHFTDANRTTVLPYLFAAAPGPGGLNGDPLNSFPNTDFVGSDNYFAAPGSAPIMAGDTLGLMHVIYTVDPGVTPGMITVTLVPFDDTTGGGTLLTDVTGRSLAASLVNGTITVRGVPEPSTILLIGLGGGLILLRRRWVGFGTE